MLNRKAVIDVGSSSIKFFLGELLEDGSLRTIFDENDIQRIGEGLRKTGEISPEAMARNIDALSRFAKKAKDNGADEIICIGTMALRNATNAVDFLKKARESCGVKVKVISGEEEARLSYLAVLSGLPIQDEKLVIFDTGGGSTEFVFGEGSKVSKRFSVDIGHIRITEKFFKNDPVLKEELDAAAAEIESVFTRYDVKGEINQMVGMGGTITAMGAVKHKMEIYKPEIIQGSKLTLCDIDTQVMDYSKKTIEERKNIVGLQPKRADVILAGSCILRAILKLLGANEVTISDRGIRHGLAFDRFVKKKVSYSLID